MMRLMLLILWRTWTQGFRPTLATKNHRLPTRRSPRLSWRELRHESLNRRQVWRKPRRPY